MCNGDRNHHLGLVCVAALLALTPTGRAAGAESGSEEVDVHEVTIVSPEGQRRIIVSDDRDEPMIVRSVMVRRARLGISLLDITPELRRFFGVSDEGTGVLVSQVLEDSPAEAAGIEVGDVLVAVDSTPISYARHLAAEIGGREAGSTVQLEGWRQGRPVTFRTELEEAPMTQVDVTPLLFHEVHPGSPGDGAKHPGAEDFHRVLELDERVLTEALRSLEVEIGSGRLDHHFEEMRQHRGGLLERLEELERRLLELEVEIDDLPPDED